MVTPLKLADDDEIHSRDKSLAEHEKNRKLADESLEQLC
jgi:hypothetical protein